MIHCHDQRSASLLNGGTQRMRLSNQISLTSYLNVLPRCFSASSWYSFGIITIIFSPIRVILPVNFMIINHLGILLYIKYLKYTNVFNSILYIVGIRMYTMKQTTQQMGDGQNVKTEVETWYNNTVDCIDSLKNEINSLSMKTISVKKLEILKKKLAALEYNYEARGQ